MHVCRPCVHVCMHMVCLGVSMHVFASECMYACGVGYVPTYVCVYACMYVYMYIVHVCKARMYACKCGIISAMHA